MAGTSAASIGRSIRADGGTAEIICADVADEQQVAELIAAITGRLGPVDVLVLNATGPPGRAGHPGCRQSSTASTDVCRLRR